MNFKEAKAYLDNLSVKGMILGLDNIKNLMDALGNPDKKMKIIHVGGTNGKGSTSTYLASILKAAGYKVGLYTSPEVYVFNERFVINGDMASDQELADLIGQIKEVSEGREIPLTIFEAETATAVLHFAENACDFAILEVGLGGTLDATNFIDRPELGVLVEIGLDHIAILGDTIEEIARTKAGIIKPGAVNVSYAQRPEVKEVLDQRVEEMQGQISYLDLDMVEVKETGLRGQTFSYGPHKDLEISLLGSYQPYNAALAVKCIEELRDLGNEISDSAMREGLKAAKIRGRFEIIWEKPLVIIDGAHNEDGAQVLVDSLREIFGDKKHLFVYGSMSDKDYSRVLDLSLPLAKKYFTVRPDNDRALTGAELKEIIEKKGGRAQAYETVSQALDAAIAEAGPEDSIICFGSLYQVGQIITYFNSGD